MSTSLLVVSHLLMSGFQAPPEDVLLLEGRIDDSDHRQRIEAGRALERPFTLAGHRSHSSHGSHRSHRSSSGFRPTPQPPAAAVQPYTPPSTRGSASTAPATILPVSPAIAPEVQRRLHGSSGEFARLVQQVQLGLYARGYYMGTVDGIAGPMTVAAISGFEGDHDMPVTGRITDALLDALAITGF